MQTSSINLSTTIPNLKPRHHHRLTQTTSLPSSLTFRSVNGLSLSTRGLGPISCLNNRKLGDWISAPALEKESDGGVEVKAAEVSGEGVGDGEVVAKSKMAETLVLGSLFGLWENLPHFDLLLAEEDLSSYN
ncbi:hypothetical protein Tco_1052359 [Tanacetum coccineum]